MDAESRLIWKRLHLQPRYKVAAVVGGSDAETLYAESLCIPGGTLLSSSDQNRIIETVLATAP